MYETADDVLEHFGVKGMHWGVRNQRSSSSPQRTTKEKLLSAGKVLGSAAAVAAIAAGAIYAGQHLNTSLSDANPSAAGSKLASSLAKEPVGIVHASRANSKGFTFLQRGGLDDPITEYDQAGFDRLSGTNTLARYGSRNERIAARFTDPEGRVDRAGRPIFHEVMLPESMSSGINNIDQVRDTSWPLIRDTYSALYDEG